MNAADSINSRSLIKPSKGYAPLKLRDLWEYRELLYFFVWRDLKIRYKQTILGVAWVIIKPVLTMVAFTTIFGTLAKVPSDGLPYPLFTYCALLAWQLFAHSLTESANSLVANQHLITKVYFPRLIIPLAVVGTGLVDFLVASLVLVGMIGFYQLAPSSSVWLLPVFVFLAIATALGIGLWLSALSIEYRDVRHTLPFLTQIWLFATPIAYPIGLIPEQWRAFYALNPMVGIVEGFRWTLVGAEAPSGFLLRLSAVVAMVLLISGTYYFRLMERKFADVV